MLHVPCLAYLDPVLITFLPQMVVAAVVGGGVYFRERLSRLFNVFRPRKKDEEPIGGQPQQPAESRPGG
ncbi:MAG: hypothetical protein IH987_05510 [Planctomycetes bacterium]|nr:hypothetical protein [Planctomycetota bacterium]